MVDMVRENEQRIAAYTANLKEKVDRNDLAQIHRRYAAVLSTLSEKKCSLNNAYRLAGTARSTIRDFIGIAELKILNEVTYQSTFQRLGDPKLSVKGIEQECRR